ncbi:MAG: cold-shock protein [Nitrospirae bacterium]|nr:cold-shock protein [Nitrospirota bacterium]
MPHEGKVKWFNSSKGYGFITDDADGKDIFVHYSSITSSGYKTLEDGQKVSFEVETDKKGLRAVKVSII